MPPLPPPARLVYREELLSPDEERELLDVLEQVDFEEIRMHGVVARRTAKHYVPHVAQAVVGSAA